MFSVHIDTARSWRGGQNQVLLTVLGLRKRGHRTSLIANSHGELYRRAPEDLDLYPLAPRADVDPLSAWKLSRLFLKLRPDVIHAHDAHAVAVAALARSLIGRRLSPPLIASRRVDFHVGKHVFSRWKYSQVHHFICASLAIQNMLIDDGIPHNRTTVVYEGIDLTLVDKAPQLDVHKEFGIPIEAPLICNVAALTAHKGQRHLIDAAALVVREVPEARFLIVGTGELKDTLKRQIRRLHLENNVILTGFRTDTLSILNGIDLFVMSSVTEGLGTSVLDAMAAGLPVISTRAGGIPESVVDGETGILVPVGDQTWLAQALVALLRAPTERVKFGEAGRRRAHNIFSADRMVDEIVSVYAAWVDTTREAGIARRPSSL